MTADQIDPSDTTVPVTRIETISNGTINFEKVGFISENDARADKKLEVGDICFSNINSLKMIGNCAIYLGGQDIYGGMNLLVLRPGVATHPQYLYWTIRSDGFRETVESYAKPAINQASISQSSLLSISICTPSKEEQIAIATFLDRETAKIDALVAEQEKLIALLQEKRQAVISHAVTKGLNPNVPMKDSGVEWLGEVPGHWEVLRLKNLAEESLKYGANEAAELDDPSLPRFVRITDVAENGSLRDETFKSLPRELAEPFLLREGDVLLARSGATVGKSFMYQPHWGEACFAGYLIRVRLCQRKCIPQWLNYYCRSDSYWRYVLGCQIQSTIQNVSAEKYANLVLPVPAIEDQQVIVAFLDHETAKLDTLMTEAHTAITLLQERRTALISAAVTGQIDVRALAGASNAPDSVAASAYPTSV